jgi:RNA polymerase sigma-70 factor (ECF subfamily)
LSETFAVALERWPSYDAERDPLPWLWGITTNLLRRHRRQQSRTLKAISASVPDEPPDDVMSASKRLDYRRVLDLVKTQNKQTGRNGNLGAGADSG